MLQPSGVLVRSRSPVPGAGPRRTEISLSPHPPSLPPSARPRPTPPCPQGYPCILESLQIKTERAAVVNYMTR
jgi:hypothetical protein